MDCRLYPRPVPITTPDRAAGNRLQIWIGLFDVTAAPPLQWLVNGTPAAPTSIAPLGAVRDARLVAADVPRAFSGIYEFTGLQPDTSYTFTADVGGERVSVAARTLPNELPAGLNNALHVLLVSCYYQPEDRSELVSAVIRRLSGSVAPQLTLLMGDQVYLDLPTLTDFEDDAAWLAGWFEGYYTRNWRGPGGLTAILSSAPCISIPDDHEYWNNAPHSARLWATRNPWPAGNGGAQPRKCCIGDSNSRPRSEWEIHSSWISPRFRFSWPTREPKKRGPWPNDDPSGDTSASSLVRPYGPGTFVRCFRRWAIALRHPGRNLERQCRGLFPRELCGLSRHDPRADVRSRPGTTAVMSHRGRPLGAGDAMCGRESRTQRLV